MSQYTLAELGQVRFVVGWDAQLNTFFFQGWIHPEESDAPLFACGCRMGEFQSLSLLVEYLEHYGIAIPDELLKALENDKKQMPVGELTEAAKYVLSEFKRLSS